MSTDKSELVALVYRADWKQLSLSATVSSTLDPAVQKRLLERKAAQVSRALGPLQRAWRVPETDFDRYGPVHSVSSLLIAPGGRYRVEDSHGSLDICDGEQSWHVGRGVAKRGRGGRPGRHSRGLLTPQWLIACYELEVTGTAVVAGRAVIAVTGRPRAASTRRRGLLHFLDSVEVLVDAELGILLRSRQVLEGGTPESAELLDVTINPPEAAEPGMFAPPPGVRVEDAPDPFAGFKPPSSVGWQVAGAAAGAAATALGFAVRHAPRPKVGWPTDDEEPEMPADAVLASEDWEPGQPPDDRTVNLLHGTGLSPRALTAVVHEWNEVLPRIQNFKELQDKMPPPMEGIFGPDSVWDALLERAAEDGGGHRVARIAVQFPSRYRIDYLSGDWNKPYKAIACDGEYTTKLFGDRVATGPVKPLEAGLAAMFDAAWLLNGWRLAVIGAASVAGRDGTQIRAVTARTADNGADNLFTRAEVVVDVELGILLRSTTYVNDQPATRTELRDLRPADETARFRIVPEAGMRSVADSGGPLGDRDLPRPAEAAATAATLMAAGAVAVTGWLDKHRARRDQQGSEPRRP